MASSCYILSYFEPTTNIDAVICVLGKPIKSGKYARQHRHLQAASAFAKTHITVPMFVVGSKHKSI